MGIFPHGSLGRRIEDHYVHHRICVDSRDRDEVFRMPRLSSPRGSALSSCKKLRMGRVTFYPRQRGIGLECPSPAIATRRINACDPLRSRITPANVVLRFSIWMSLANSASSNSREGSFRAHQVFRPHHGNCSKVHATRQPRVCRSRLSTDFSRGFANCRCPLSLEFIPFDKRTSPRCHDS